MNKEKCIPIYSKAEWLNSEKSPSIGSVSCFLGYFPEKDKDISDCLSAWLRVGDCHVISCLHKADFDYLEDYIDKIEKLRDFIDKYLEKLIKFQNNDDIGIA